MIISHQSSGKMYRLYMPLKKLSKKWNNVVNYNCKHFNTGLIWPTSLILFEFVDSMSYFDLSNRHVQTFGVIILSDVM